MFGRKTEFLMQLDAEVRYPLENLRREPDFAALPEYEQKTLLYESLVRQVAEVAREEVRSHRQKWQSAEVDPTTSQPTTPDSASISKVMPIAGREYSSDGPRE